MRMVLLMLLMLILMLLMIKLLVFMTLLLTLLLIVMMLMSLDHWQYQNQHRQQHQEHHPHDRQQSAECGVTVSRGPEHCSKEANNTRGARSQKATDATRRLEKPSSRQEKKKDPNYKKYCKT